jgi:hypothetical protein
VPEVWSDYNKFDLPVPEVWSDYNKFDLPVPEVWSDVGPVLSLVVGPLM